MIFIYCYLISSVLLVIFLISYYNSPCIKSLEFAHQINWNLMIIWVFFVVVVPLLLTALRDSRTLVFHHIV